MSQYKYNMGYYAKNGKFKFTIWLKEEWPEIWKQFDLDNKDFSEQLAVAKSTYYIKQKEGTLYKDYVL